MEVIREGYSEKELENIFTEEVDHHSLMSCNGICNCD